MIREEIFLLLIAQTLHSPHWLCFDLNMSGYLNNFVEYVLNLFKKEIRPGRRNVTVTETAPRRCNSVIENRRMKEVIAKQGINKNIWTANDGKQNKQKAQPVAEGCCPSKVRLTPVRANKFYGQGDADLKRIYDIDDRKRNDSKNIEHDCCFYHDGYSKDFRHFITSYQRPSKVRDQSFGLKRSYSLEFVPPYLEDKSWIGSRKKFPIRPNTAPEGNFQYHYPFTVVILLLSL
ncbi:uncharacterized protein NPIL_681121 [Nephila pilipes]|uniref:Uncharacterized protein n=1 Tax=Nephila pilipes TaxID=299642 RepID=A0A8X6MVN6_NEPPI|nr:uncharacterized protein NPIL_681121 [Nephila pilipes]